MQRKREWFEYYAKQCCLDIYSDHSEEEIKKYTSKSVQKAWKVGKEFKEYINSQLQGEK